VSAAADVTVRAVSGLARGGGLGLADRCEMAQSDRALPKYGHV